MSLSKCLDCGRPVTWDEQRRQFGHAIKVYGLTQQEAKQAMPRCQKCTTTLLNPRRSVSPVSEVSEVSS
jgi:hypothetical protein